MSVSLVEPVVELIVELVERGSYPLVVTLMALESALIPIPSEVIMPFAGFLVYEGKMDFWLAVTSGVLGNLIGSLAIYLIGAKIGWDPVERKLSFLFGKSLRKARKLFDEQGELAVFFGRVLPAVRTVISLPAGLSRMDLIKFTLLTVLGSVPWNLALVYSGMVLRDNWEVISMYLDPLALAVVLGLVVYVAWERN